MIFTKKFFLLKKTFSLILISILFSACSQQQVLTGSVGTVIASSQDEKTLGDVIDDTSIAIGIKEKLFMYDASLLGKINVNVEKGKVLLTGRVKDQAALIEVIRLAWMQKNVQEVINEIAINESFNIKTFAEDKLIQAQIISKVFTDQNIKKLKYNFEVQNKVIYILGITSDINEFERVKTHARSIKGVFDIISYVDILGPENSSSIE